MTDIKKKEKGKGGAKPKKLQLNKETLKDLSLSKSEKEKVVGGRARCTSDQLTACRC